MVDHMTITEALELAREASDAYNTGCAYADVTYVPWTTISHDLSTAATELRTVPGSAGQRLVRALRDRAEDAQGRAQRQASRRAARILVFAVEVL